MFAYVDEVGREVGCCASWRGVAWRGRHIFVPELEALRQAFASGLLSVC